MVASKMMTLLESGVQQMRNEEFIQNSCMARETFTFLFNVRTPAVTRIVILHGYISKIDRDAGLSLNDIYMSMKLRMIQRARDKTWIHVHLDITVIDYKKILQCLILSKTIKHFKSWTLIRFIILHFYALPLLLPGTFATWGAITFTWLFLGQFLCMQLIGWKFK